MFRHEEKGRTGPTIRSENGPKHVTDLSTVRQFWGPVSDPKSPQRTRRHYEDFAHQKENQPTLSAGTTSTLAFFSSLPRSVLPDFPSMALRLMGNEPSCHRRRGCRLGGREGLSKKALRSLVRLFDPVWISCPLVVALCPYTSGHRVSHLLQLNEEMDSMSTGTHPGLPSAPPTPSLRS